MLSMVYTSAYIMFAINTAWSKCSQLRCSCIHHLVTWERERDARAVAEASQLIGDGSELLLLVPKYAPVVGRQPPATPRRAVHCRAVPCRAVPHRATPCHSRQCHAMWYAYLAKHTHTDVRTHCKVLDARYQHRHQCQYWSQCSHSSWCKMITLFCAALRCAVLCCIMSQHSAATSFATIWDSTAWCDSMPRVTTHDAWSHAQHRGAYPGRRARWHSAAAIRPKPGACKSTSRRGCESMQP